MPPTKQHRTFFEHDSAHGMVKRFMFKYYLQAFLPSTHYRKIPVTIIDGCAGAGRYSHDWKGNKIDWPEEIEKYGSPLIVIRAAIDMFNEVALRKKMKTSFNFDAGLEIDELVQEKVNFDAGLEIDELVQDKVNFDAGLEIDELVQDKVKNLNVTSVDGQQKICVDDMLKCDPDRKITVTLLCVEPCEVNYRALVENIVAMFERYSIKTCPLEELTKGFVRIKSANEHFPIQCILGCANFKQIHLPEASVGECLTFIDPFGISHTPFDAVRRFLGIKRDVFLTFMSRNVITQPKKTSKSAEFLGCTADEVHAMVCQSTDSVQILENYGQRLKDVTGIKYYSSFEMRDKHDAIFFNMLFASDSIRSMAKMKEAFNRGAQEPSELVLSDYKVKARGMTINLKNIQEKDDVANAIFKKFEGKQGVGIDKIMEYVILDTSYVFRKTPLADLQKKKRIYHVRNYAGKEQKQSFRFPDKDEHGNDNNWTMTFREGTDTETANASPRGKTRETDSNKSVENVPSKRPCDSPQPGTSSSEETDTETASGSPRSKTRETNSSKSVENVHSKKPCHAPQPGTSSSGDTY